MPQSSATPGFAGPAHEAYSATSVDAHRSTGLRERARPWLKRAMDISIACAALVAASPVMAAAAIAVRLDGGPVFFAHKRVGRDGRTFGCLKFRSMTVDAEAVLDRLLREDPAAREEWDSTRKLKTDPRVTRVGRFLRATSLDELPQLLNVVRGDMSLVGPRPVVQRELEQFYGAAAGAYLQVRPGITGPWQVSGRSDVGYDTRVELDTAYAREPSLRTDLAILVKTVPAVLRRQGAC